MPAETTRRSLIGRLRALDDQEAWREFDASYRELILRYALRRGLQAADAEDVRQEVMLSLARSLPGFEYRPEVGRFRDFLGTIVRHAAWARLNKLTRVREAGAPGQELEELAPAGDESWNDEWIQHHYRTAMAHVRTHFEAESLAIFDELLQGTVAAQIAARRGTTSEAVYKTKQRVRDALKERIEMQLREEDERDGS
jgi:RNA polymerase sigma-70 factor (ECF subfamily)